MITTLQVAIDLRPRQGRGARLLRQQARAREGPGRQAGRLPLADGPRPRRGRHRDLPRAARPAAARRGDRRAAPRAGHQGRPQRPRLQDGRRPGAVRDPQGARRHRLHPGAHRPLLRHRHGPPRPVRQPDPDPPAGEGRPEGDGLSPQPHEGELDMPTKQATKSKSETRNDDNVFTRGGARRGGGDRPRAKGRVRPEPRAGASRRTAGPSRQHRQDAGRRPGDGRTDPRARHGRRARACGEDVLRHAGLRDGGQERQGDRLLQAQVEVQGPLFDLRLPARREPRRRRHVAGRVRGDEADPERGVEGSRTSSRKPRAESWPATGARSRFGAPARTTSRTSASTSRNAG